MRIVRFRIARENVFLSFIACKAHPGDKGVPSLRTSMFSVEQLDRLVKINSHSILAVFLLSRCGFCRFELRVDIVKTSLKARATLYVGLHTGQMHRLSEIFTVVYILVI